MGRPAGRALGLPLWMRPRPRCGRTPPQLATAAKAHCASASWPPRARPPIAHTRARAAGELLAIGNVMLISARDESSHLSMRMPMPIHEFLRIVSIRPPPANAPLQLEYSWVKSTDYRVQVRVRVGCRCVRGVQVRVWSKARSSQLANGCRGVRACRRRGGPSRQPKGSSPRSCCPAAARPAQRLSAPAHTAARAFPSLAEHCDAAVGSTAGAGPAG